MSGAIAAHPDLLHYGDEEIISIASGLKQPIAKASSVAKRLGDYTTVDLAMRRPGIKRDWEIALSAHNEYYL